MARFPRSLRLYVAASTIYAASVFLAVRVIYGLELGRAGLRMPDPEAVLSSIDTVSFITWLGLSVIGGVVLYRVATALQGARDESGLRETEIGSIFALGQGLSGSLDLVDIAKEFISAAQRSLGPSVTVALFVYDDVVEAFRTVLEAGPNRGTFVAESFSATALPAAIRTRVIDHHQPLVLPDTTSRGEQWERIAAGLPHPEWIRSFATLPLVTHERLVGVVFSGSDAAQAITADRVQMTVILGQFVAGALGTALSLRDAEARADREALITRITQRARASLDPDEVLRATVEELGRAMHVTAVVAASGTTPADLRVAAVWSSGSTTDEDAAKSLPVARLVAQTDRTGVFSDVATDPRLAIAHRPAGGARAVLATPIRVAGELAGTLSLLEVDRPRDWTADDVRLVEGVARELRVAMETARLFQSRQRENERLIALQRASAALSAQSSARNVIEEILRTAAGLIGHGSSSLYQWDEGAKLLRVVQNFDPEGRMVPPTLRTGEGVVGEAFATLTPVIANDYQHWRGAIEHGKQSGIQAVLAVPIVLGGRGLGVISIRLYEAGISFSEEESRLLTLFGDQAAAALTTAEAFARQRQAVEQLERLNRAKSEFVSIVSHEFRTPLTGIQGFSEMMRDENLSTTEMKEYAGDINRDAQRLTRMINDMLDLARIESGRMTLRREPVDLNAVVEDVASRIRPLAPDHTIVLDLQPDLPKPHADRDRMTQVVSNLLNNAVKYSPTGGEIALRTRADGAAIRLLVKDEGLGIPRDALESIFERFSRVESDATEAIQGTGLGLPIVRQIVELHGGKVWAESEIGRGSVFQVVLPLAGGAAPVEA